MNDDSNWFEIGNIDSVDSPALAVYPDRIQRNIDSLIASIDDVSRLRPHVKTHKSAEVMRMMIGRGITKYKCATIAEAEVLGAEDAPDVLLAYQPVGPKAERLLQLVTRFPATSFSCLVDNADAAAALSACFMNAGRRANVFVDLNVGMNRTGIAPVAALRLIGILATLPGLKLIGLHAYDGHLRDPDLDARRQKCDDAFAGVAALYASVVEALGIELTSVAGGTPTYSVHRLRPLVECSPGTFIYWDKGYAEILAEQRYAFAALVITRVVSLPAPDLICVDLGHKAIASENPIDKRVTFLNAGRLTPVGHSEEHMVFRIEDTRSYQVGNVLYGVPYHICPTVALHQNPAIVRDGRVREYWNTVSRSRMLTV
jgi:D-serine deaminase-like pyridoxal phosphate-dependent protein